MKAFFRSSSSDATPQRAEAEQEPEQPDAVKLEVVNASYQLDPADIQLEKGDDAVIGVGGEGFVRRGLYYGTDVAVKVTTIAIMGDPIIGQTIKEVKLLQALHHPNIVTLYGVAVKVTSMDTKLMLYRSSSV